MPATKKAAEAPAKRKAGSQVGNVPLTNAPIANTAAVVTLAAVAGQRGVMKRINWSYNAAPTAGRLTITDNAVTVFDLDITVAGPGSADFTGDGFQSSARNSALVATLSAAGAAVIGKLNAVAIYTA